MDTGMVITMTNAPEGRAIAIGSLAVRNDGLGWILISAPFIGTQGDTRATRPYTYINPYTAESCLVEQVEM
jgi:hypothetical protein